MSDESVAQLEAEREYLLGKIRAVYEESRERLEAEERQLQGKLRRLYSKFKTNFGFSQEPRRRPEKAKNLQSLLKEQRSRRAHEQDRLELLGMVMEATEGVRSEVIDKLEEEFEREGELKPNVVNLSQLDFPDQGSLFSRASTKRPEPAKPDSEVSDPESR